MKIHIDFVHLPNVNLFKNLIKIFNERGDEIIFTVQKRGRLPQILNKEIPGYKRTVFGKHRGTIYSIIIESNFLRFFYMIIFILRNKPDIALNAGSFPQMIASWLLGIKNITISDDPERKYDFKFFDIFATRVIFPPIIEQKGKYLTFNALKEWSYLSPDYFKPNESALTPYNIKKKQYIFIREVSVGSINYVGQQSGLVSTFAEKLPNDLTVLLSLENKNTRNLYPKNWILLQEPINDIHSLMYFSKAVISSGDSMAREGGMLGVPSLYCGIRDMKANDMLIKFGILHKILPNDVPSFILNELKKTNENEQENIRNIIHKEWSDVNSFIIKSLNQVLAEKQK